LKRGIFLSNVPDMSDVPLGIYKHYKGKDYEVIGTAKHSETMEEFVVYWQLYGERKLWIRPKAMFLETITVDGKKQARFQHVGNSVQ
jgi:hypothetical protein